MFLIPWVNYCNCFVIVKMKCICITCHVPLYLMVILLCGRPSSWRSFHVACAVVSPSSLIMIALRILGAIVTSVDVVTVVVTPPVLIDLMKAKIMFRLFCHNQIYVTHLLVRFVQVRRSPSWNKTQCDSVWYCLF